MIDIWNNTNETKPKDKYDFQDVLGELSIPKDVKDVKQLLTKANAIINQTLKSGIETKTVIIIVLGSIILVMVLSILIIVIVYKYYVKVKTYTLAATRGILERKRGCLGKWCWKEATELPETDADRQIELKRKVSMQDNSPPSKKRRLSV